MCEKFHYDRLRNDIALGNRKSVNSKNPKKKNNVRSMHWGPVSESRILSQVAKKSAAVFSNKKMAAAAKNG